MFLLLRFHRSANANFKMLLYICEAKTFSFAAKDKGKLFEKKFVLICFYFARHLNSALKNISKKDIKSRGHFVNVANPKSFQYGKKFL